MRRYTYDYQHGIQKISSYGKTLKTTTSSIVLTFVVLAGVVTPMAVTHAQGGAGGGGTNTGGGSTSTGGGTGGGSTTGGGSATGGGNKTVCDPVASFTATADQTGITANYTPALCISGRTTVNMLLRNTATGNIEYQLVDPASNSIFYANPRFASNYTAELTVSSLKTTPATVIGTRTVQVVTPSLGTNCATITKNDPVVGYWGVYDAIWINFTAVDCGYGRQTVELKATNLSTGQVELDAPGMGLSGMLDFEGPIVKYDTPYRVDVIVHGAMGEVLDTSSVTVQSTVLR